MKQLHTVAKSCLFHQFFFLIATTTMYGVVLLCVSRLALRRASDAAACVLARIIIGLLLSISAAVKLCFLENKPCVHVQC